MFEIEGRMKQPRGGKAEDENWREGEEEGTARIADGEGGEGKRREKPVERNLEERWWQCSVGRVRRLAGLSISEVNSIQVTVV